MKTLALLVLVAVAVSAAAATGAIAATQQTSSNWAGYAVTPLDPTQSFSNVSGSWTQPAATCTRGSATYSTFWVGLGGFNAGAQALEQTGTEADCSATGSPVYYAWYELVPAAPVTIQMTIVPGDAISASVTVSGQTVTLQLSDTTRGTAFTQQLTAATVDTASAEWIAEAPSTCSRFGGCTPLPLTNFGSLAFTEANAIAAGHLGTISDPAVSATALTLQGVSSVRRFGRFRFATPVANALPGALSTDGTSFSVAWQLAASGRFSRARVNK